MAWHSGVSFDPPGVVAAIQSPVHASPVAASPDDERSPRKRKRSSAGALQNGEDTSQDSPTTKAKHQPGVKRACNDCRQQKVSANILRAHVRVMLLLYAPDGLICAPLAITATMQRRRRAPLQTLFTVHQAQPGVLHRQ